MSENSAADIIEAGLAEAGDTSLTTLAYSWLNNWLRSQYAAWSWPFLKERATAISLASGATSLTVGGGNGGITNKIHRIFPPITIYRTDRTVAAKANIRQLVDGEVAMDEDAADPSTFKGVPTEFRYQILSTDGVQKLIPLPFPDRDLLLAFWYQLRPADVTILTAASAVPYPADRTIQQAIVQKALAYMHGPSSPEALTAGQILQSMVLEDRSKYGTVPGDGDRLVLDTGVFR